MTQRISPLQRLRDIVIDGVAADIYLAERARELHRQIGEYADQINAAGFGELFGTIQNAAVGELTLSVTKIFEHPSKRYPTRSIPAAIALMRNSASALPVADQGAALHDLQRFGIESRDLSSLEGESFTRELADLLDASCPDGCRLELSPLESTLNALRASRDKALAHNEAIEPNSLPRGTWADLEQLLRFAKRFVGLLGIGYFGTVYTTDDDHYVPRDEALVASLQLRRLLKAHGISSSRQSPG